MSGRDDETPGAREGEDEVEAEAAEEEGGDLEAEYEEDIEEEDAEDFGDAEDFDSDEDLKVVDEVLSHKDQNARALAIRRAIEERLEAKRLSKDLDYLDLDLDSDD